MFVIMGATFVFVYCHVLFCLVTPATFLLHIDWEGKRPGSLLVSSAENIVSLISLCDLDTEHTGLSQQKPDQVRCRAIET